MPVCFVHLFEGRTVDQKRKLVRAITDAMVEHADCMIDGLHVGIQEYTLENWARRGVLGPDRKDLPPEQTAAYKPKGKTKGKTKKARK